MMEAYGWWDTCGGSANGRERVILLAKGALTALTRGRRIAYGYGCSWGQRSLKGACNADVKVSVAALSLPGRVVEHRYPRYSLYRLLD